MKVLVTGGAGFLGTYVIPALLSRGHSVRAMVRPGTTAKVDPQPSMEVVEADLRTSRDLAGALEGMDVVVHLAARVTGSDEARFASTVVGTERLLSAMSEATVRRLVLVSSYSVYDWTAARDVLSERSPTLLRPYGRDGYTAAKVWQERIVREAAAEEGFELVVLRPGFIWGPGQDEVAGSGIKFNNSIIVVAPRSQLPLTYVSNCADCVALAVEEPEAAGTALNVVDDYKVSAWQYAGILRRTGSVRHRFPVPYPIARAGVGLAAAISRRMSRFGGKLPSVMVPASFEARFKPLQHTASDAQKILGWRSAVALDDAVANTFGRLFDARAEIR